MLLVKKTKIYINDTYRNIIGHEQLAAAKLWNIGNYERVNYNKESGAAYPDWYDQKKRLKDNMWYKSLPSQTAQETLKLLDGAWKSYFALLKSGGVENSKPPRFKYDNSFAVTYLKDAISRTGNDTVRLTLSKGLCRFMEKTYKITDKYIYLKNKCFSDRRLIKQIKLEPDGNRLSVIIIFEVPDMGYLPDNGHYLSIDLGVHNPFSCYDSLGNGFILGRRYSDIMYYFAKEIAHYQSISDSQQSTAGVKYPKQTKRVSALYEKRNNELHDYFHKCTRYITDYCTKHHINTVIIGDITGIREDNDLGKANQLFHAMPYKQIYGMLMYKLAAKGIRLILQEEAYSSQCPPSSKEVSVQYAVKANRKKRGMYYDNNKRYNADMVGAYNIMRLALKTNKFPYLLLGNPELIAV